MTWEALAVAIGKLGINLAHAIVGALGALISLAIFKFPENLSSTFLKRLMIICIGACFSGFGTESVIGLFNLSPATAGITGLLLGLFGISLAMKIFETIQQTNLVDIIKSRFGAK